MSDRTWYVSIIGNPGRTKYVYQVRSSADDLAFNFNGAGDPVTLLSIDCTVIGVFHATPDGTYVVDAAPSITGTIERAGGSLQTSGKVVITDACGGQVNL